MLTIPLFFPLYVPFHLATPESSPTHTHLAPVAIHGLGPTIPGCSHFLLFGQPAGPSLGHAVT